jgi:photosystem II stability/assembly factor-like uncharacterized protein
MTSALTGWAYDMSTYLIVRTTDGGHHWRRATPPTEFAATGPPPVAFEDDLRAWLVGPPTGGDPTSGPAPIFRTADGGITWLQGGMIPVVSTVSEIDVLDDQHAWVAALGDCTGAMCGDEPITISQTVDGGANWSVVMDRQLDRATPGALPLSCLKSGPAFVTTSTGWVTAECHSGAPFLYITRDGGATWSLQGLPVPGGVTVPRFHDCYCDLYPPAFQSGDDGLFVAIVFNDPAGTASSSAVYVTSDGGASWTPRPSPTSYIVSPSFISATDGWVADTTAIYATHDGARSWTRVSKLPVTGGSLQFVDQRHGFASGLDQKESFLFGTDDGGQTWAQVQPLAIS